MKGYNVFLAVLIFLLALVSAVFSFFLFEKRAQLVDGWSDMATHINKTSNILDKDSGTKVGNNLTTSAMDHTKYKDLHNLLTQLPAQAEKVIAERNKLAKGLALIAQTLEAAELSEEKFQKMDSYEETVTLLTNYVDNYQTRNNKILEMITNSAEQLGAEGVSVNQLKTSEYETVYQPIDERIQYYRNRVQAFNNSIETIGNSVEMSVDASTEDEYSKILESVESKVAVTYQDLTDKKRALKIAEDEIKRLNKVVMNKDKEIAAHKETIAEKDAEIKRLRKAIGMPMDAPLPLEDGCAESLRMIRDQQKGSVMEIDEKFGFFVISVGTKTTVEEPFENCINYVNPLIPVGAELVISRNMPGKEPEYIGKVKIVKLGELYSVAEMVDNSSGKRPKVGDMVYFSDPEIEKIVKSRK